MAMGTSTSMHTEMQKPHMPDTGIACKRCGLIGGGQKNCHQSQEHMSPSVCELISRKYPGRTYSSLRPVTLYNRGVIGYMCIKSFEAWSLPTCSAGYTPLLVSPFISLLILIITKNYCTPANPTSYAIDASHPPDVVGQGVLLFLYSSRVTSFAF